MSYMFYCPNCGFEQDGLALSDIPRDRVGNARDGYGCPIYHYKCPVCGNLDAGAMMEKDKLPTWKEYCKSVISFYQGIRGFAKTEL